MKNSNTGKQRHYEIQIEEQLDDHWRNWFEEFTIDHTADDHTILSGPIQDQAALYGVLKKINNLGLTLISVNSQRLSEDSCESTFTNQLSQIDKETQV